MLIDIHTHKVNCNENSLFNYLKCEDLPSNKFTVGIHPWYLDNFSIDEVKKIAKHPNCMAIGEIGLDKLKENSFEKQLSIFKSQIEISEELELPVIIHCVKAFNEIIELKKKCNPTQPWIIHGFLKSNLTEILIQNGFYLSIGAAILTNLKLQQYVNQIPNEKLFIETDESLVDIFEIYQKISELKKISLLDLKQIVKQNNKSVFRKWQIG